MVFCYGSPSRLIQGPFKFRLLWFQTLLLPCTVDYSFQRLPVVFRTYLHACVKVVPPTTFKGRLKVTSTFPWNHPLPPNKLPSQANSHGAWNCLPDKCGEMSSKADRGLFHFHSSKPEWDTACTRCSERTHGIGGLQSSRPWVSMSLWGPPIAVYHSTEFTSGAPLTPTESSPTSRGSWHHSRFWCPRWLLCQHGKHCLPSCSSHL